MDFKLNGNKHLVINEQVEKRQWWVFSMKMHFLVMRKAF